MDPQEPITSAPTPVEQPVIHEVPKTTKDTNTITVVSMAIFVLLSLGAVAFLYYQNQQLKGMLASYQTPVASPTSVATVDPTANWKTYINTKYGYQLKRPPEYITGFFDVLNGVSNPENGTEETLDILPTENSQFKNFLQINVATSKKTLFALTNDLYIKQKNYSQTTEISELNKSKFLGFDAYDYTFTGSVMNALNWEGEVEKGRYKVSILEKEGSFYSFYRTDNVVYNQILSTFKFLEVPTASSTATPKASSTPLSY